GHPDPGVHSAAGWLLRRWGEEGRVAAARLPTGPQAGRGWFVGPQGMAFAVVSGPVTTRVGSHYFEGWRSEAPEAGLEQFHRHRISHTYALATHEVTYDQVGGFARDHAALLKGKRFGMIWSSRTGDSPAVDLDWYDAARFCRWLGDREGLPEHEQCYPPVAEIGPGMRVRPDYLRRTGYRLPTEAEWEHACRAGARAGFWYGSDVDALGANGWWLLNARNRAHPVGRLRPNPLGLFDVCGNAFEWCGVRADPYPHLDGVWPVFDYGPADAPCGPDDPCALRGGDFPRESARSRAAHRTVVPRKWTWPASGLRVARTVAAPPLDVFRVSPDGVLPQYEVRGAPGRFRVTEAGGARVEPAEGPVPGSFTVFTPGDAARTLSLAVERTDTGHRVSVTDAYIPVKWATAWYRWPADPADPDRGPTDEVWAAATAGRPVAAGPADHLRFVVNEQPPAAGAPAAYGGLVATAAVDLPAGGYTVDAVGPCKVTIDGELVLTQGWRGHVPRTPGRVRLAAGRHDLRVEYAYAGGPIQCDFSIRWRGDDEP
ncbi:MAG: formylglycine-generating enzyme family protein, partial [Gemmataceae bacterium]|nr:formylglycine-generating enzyme family protein [Gemmataceae bacterium]